MAGFGEEEETPGRDRYAVFATPVATLGFFLRTPSAADPGQATLVLTKRRAEKKANVSSPGHARAPPGLAAGTPTLLAVTPEPKFSQVATDMPFS